jgi:iron complex outermembrane receptor protein
MHRISSRFIRRLSAPLLSWSLVATALAVAGATPAHAEDANPCVTPGATAARVTGVVADTQGGRVQGATVTVRCTSGDVTVVSDASGAFALDVRPGTHRVRITLDGFEPLAQDVTVDVGSTVALDAVLQLASVADRVTVHGTEATVPRRDTTATRMDVPLLETPQSVSVVTAAQIAEQASPNLQEALRYTAGARNELYGIDNRGDWFSFRGSDQSTVLLNGMRLPLTGWYGVVREEPYAYERMTVLRGPSSIVAGQNDPGGVLNLSSKRPLAERTNELSAKLGNHNHTEIRFDTTGPLNADRSLLYRVVAVGKNADTQVDYADEQRALVAPSLTWRGARGALTGYGEYQYDRSKNTNAFLGREGTLDPAPNGPIPTDLFIGEPDWDRYGGTRWRAGYEGHLNLGTSWRLRQSTRYDDVHGLMESMYAAWWDGFLDASGTADPSGRYLGRYWYIADDSARVLATEALLEGRHRTGTVEHTLLFGVDAMRHEASQTTAQDLGTPLDVYAPVYGSFARPTLGDAAPMDSRIGRFGFFAQDQMKVFDRLSVRAGVRRDRVRNTASASETTTDWATTGNLGVVYAVTPQLAPYVSYSQSFDPVSGTDAAGRAFEPKRAEQVEAGLKWESQAAPVQASAAYYTITERNRLASDPDNFLNSIQIGEADLEGVELEARGEVASWTTMGSFTWSKARASAASFGGDLDPTEQLEGIPEHQASLWTVHDFTHLGLAGVKFGGGVRYIGRVGDGTGEVFVPAVTLFDLMGSYAFRNWRLSLNVNNLTDKPYIATCLARGDCWFGQRRTVSLTTGFGF